MDHIRGRGEHAQGHREGPPHEHEHSAGHHHGDSGKGHAGHSHEGMIEDFKRRLIVSVILTAPVVALSPLVQSLLGYHVGLPGAGIVQWLLSTVIYFYGGYPFLKGLVDEVKRRLPGMMTLIGVAISVAYLYSTASLFLVRGQTFFWELATLIDVMLLGHLIEMKSIAGASKALALLAKSLPTRAHLLRDGRIVDVPVSEVKPGTGY